jgi:hypothetical protein
MAMLQRFLRTDGDQFRDAKDVIAVKDREMISAEALRRMPHGRIVELTVDIDEETLEAVKRSRMAPGHEHLNAELDDE